MNESNAKRHRLGNYPDLLVAPSVAMNQVEELK